MILSSLLIKERYNIWVWHIENFSFLSQLKKKDVQTDLGFEMVCFYYAIMSSNTYY